MGHWHQDWKAGIALRACGAAACGISYLAISALIGLRLGDGQLPDGVLPFVLAAAGFLRASVGSALLALGHHIFDEVEISQRWQSASVVDDHAGLTDTVVRFDAQGEGHVPYFMINQGNVREVVSLRCA